VAAVLIIVLGVISFMGMTTDLLPEIELPYVVVITSYPGASPEQVERTVTAPLEAVLGTTSGLKNINSISRENASVIILEFVQRVNMDSIMIELANNLDLVSSQLDDSVGKPMMLRINPDMIPVMVATVDMEGADIDELSKLVSDKLLPAFERIDGVASVTATGLLEKELQVSLNQEKIDRLNGKVMQNLDRSLEKTHSQLKEAQAQLDEAIRKLEKETADRQTQLAEAGVQLDGAIANLNALLSEETLLNAQKTAFEEEKKVLQQLAEMEPLFRMLFPTGVSSLSPEIFALVMAQLEPRLPEELRGISQEEMAELEKKALEAPSRSAAIDTELQNISLRLMTLSAMKPELEKALDEAAAGYRQVESGKISLAIELARARIQLENSRAELEKGLSELQEAREEARKQADLNNVITEEMISSILMAQNFTMPAGYIQEGESGHLVKVVGRYESEENLADTILFSTEEAGDIRLVDVADITMTGSDQRTYAKVNGNDGVLLTFHKQSTASTSTVADQINSLIHQLTAEHQGLHILPLMDQGEYIHMSIDNVLQNLLLGGLLAIIVLLVFLKDVRPTLLIAVSIPISLMFAMALMYFSNVTLNVISLSGLALGVGMLVDNSIVVIENIYRLRLQGVPVYRAAVYGTQQVTGAITASTLTTVCVFLPIVFTQGISRQLFTDMGLTIAYSLLASLAVALTLVPTMASTFFQKVEAKRLSWFEAMRKGYLKLLRFALDHKFIVLLLVSLLFGLSVYGVTVMGTSFFPEMDSPQLSATLTMPEGSTKEEIYAMNDEVIQRLLEIEAVDSVGAMTGSTGLLELSGSSSGDTSFFILLKDKRSLTSREVERLIYEKTADLEAEISVTSTNMDMTALGGSGIEVIIKGQDLDLLASCAEEVAEILRATEGTTEVLTGNEEAGTETRIIVDRDAAMRHGLTVAQIFQEISAALSPETKSTTLLSGSEEYPVVIVNAERANINRDNLADYTFTVTDREGTKKEVRLGDVAEITTSISPASIFRDNQSRHVTVTASIADGYNIGLVSRDFEKKLAGYTPPPGVSLEVAGENEMITSAMEDIILMIILASIFIYLIMVAQFQSLLSPFIIMFTLPLAFTGGLLLLWIAGMELSVTALLGFLLLAGVVVNNGIVFVDLVNQLRLEGMDKREALLETAAARIRPILMTALTTILAMSTMALGLGRGAEITQPLAVVSIGGLTYATLLTLIVVPVLYDLLHRRPMKKIEIEG